MQRLHVQIETMMQRYLPGLLVVFTLSGPAMAEEPPEGISPEDANMAELEELMAQVQARVAALGKAGATRDDALKFLTKQVEQAIGNMAGQEEANESLQRKNADLNWEIEGLLESDTALNEKLALATQEHDDSVLQMQTQIAELIQLLSLEEEEKAQLIAAKDELQAKLEVADRDRQASSLALAEVRSARTADQDTATAQREEISRLSKQVAALHETIATMSDALLTSQEDIARRKKDAADLEKRLEAALKTNAAELSEFRSEFFERLATAIGTHPDMRVAGDRFVFQSEVLFESGSAQIGEAGKKQLARLARTLRELAPVIPDDLDWVLRVDGHTDRRAINTAEFRSNWELSTARAITVVRFLMRQGITPNRLAATGFGEFQPFDPTNDEIAYRRNRRIEFKLTQR